MALHDPTVPRPVLLVGAGRLGSALIRGWEAAGALAPADLIIIEPNPGEHLAALAARGAELNPGDERLGAARSVILAVKPQIWRQAVEGLATRLSPDAVIISLMAGVGERDLSAAFAGRPTARVLPSTAVAVGRGVAAIHAADEAARQTAHALFDPVATTVDLDDEAQIDAAIGVSGSAPGFFYAFVEALEAAGEAQGLPAEVSSALARAALAGAAALMAESGEDPARLRADVTSAGGTTQAGLDILHEGDALDRLVAAAVAAAADRARELGAQSTKARSST